MTLPVSIIIPVYNCGAMFPLCLQSLREQTLTDFEVILVNNGSSDGSAEIAEQAARQDARFHVIHHPQGQAGEARNVGTAAACGEYIAFVDGDDRLSPDYLEQLYTAACRAKADIAVCGFRYYFLHTGQTKSGVQMSDKLYTKEAALGLLLRDNHMKFYLWGKLFRRRLFTQHHIVIPDMYYEDAAATPQLFYFANRVVSTSGGYYCYTRAFSKYTEKKMTAQRVNDYINTIPLIRLFLEEQGCYEAFRPHLYSHVFHVYFALPSMIKQSAAQNRHGTRENLRRARAKVRLCLRCPAAVLKKLNLKKPVVE